MQKREGEEEEDNEGVCGPRCSCGRRARARLTDKIVNTDGKDGGREGQRREMEMGLQTEDWAPGAERHILVWHGRGGDRGRAGKMDGTKKASIKGHGRAPLAQMFTLRTLLPKASVLCLHLCAYGCQPPSFYGFVSMRQ